MSLVALSTETHNSTIDSASCRLPQCLLGNGKMERKSPSTLPPGNFGGWPFIRDIIPFMMPHSFALLGTYIDQNISKYILQNEGRLFGNSFPTSIKEILGNWSMLALAGDIHREMRSIAVNFMSSVKLRTYFLKDIDIQAVNILDAWKVNSTFSAKDQGKKFAFNLMVKHLMNMDPRMPEIEEIRKEYVLLHGGDGFHSFKPSWNRLHRSSTVKVQDSGNIMGQKLDEGLQKIKKAIKDWKKRIFLPQS